MVKVYKKKHSAFQRNILQEFLSEKELETLDYIYNLAKVEREIKRAKLQYKKWKKK